MTASLDRNLKEEGSVYWALASHLVAILGMFTDLSLLKFNIVSGSTKRCGAIYFNGDVEGTFLVNMAAEKKRTELYLYTDRQVLVFNDLLQDDNLGYAIEFFRDILDGKKDGEANLKMAISVTEIIKKIQENE